MGLDGTSVMGKIIRQSSPYAVNTILSYLISFFRPFTYKQGSLAIN